MNRKFRCLTVGYIEARKGQDILVEAVRRLPEEVRVNCEFLLVGQATSLLAQKLKEDIRDITEIEMAGTLDRHELHQVYSETDIMIISSREDPMPTVAAEAMMHSIPCIVSDASGMAGYITEGENGWTFTSQNIQELAEKIEWCCRHREETVQAGEKARMLYEELFSMEVFERNLLALIDGM